MTYFLLVEGTNEASDGIIKVVTGIQSGSWQNVVLGGLSMITSIAALMGPAGMMLSVALSIFSMVFSMFGTTGNSFLFSF